MKRWEGAVDQIVFAEVDASGHALDARLTGMYDGILKLLPECRHVPVFHYGTKGHFENALDTFRRHIRLHGARRILVGAVNDPTALGAFAGVSRVWRRRELRSGRAGRLAWRRGKR